MEVIKCGMMFGLPVKQEACVGAGGTSWLPSIHSNDRENRNIGVDGVFTGCEGRGWGRQGSQVEM